MLTEDQMSRLGLQQTIRIGQKMAGPGEGHAAIGLDHEETGAGNRHVQGILRPEHFSLGKVCVSLQGSLFERLGEPVRKSGVTFESRRTDIGQVVRDDIRPEQVPGHIAGDSAKIKIHFITIISYCYQFRFKCRAKNICDPVDCAG